ncbi:PIG-X-domain-containing protein [Aulographum hederae CBS 113979]|uniref:Protein PBN1 n=1 Tax=Aulographum hederae CBS 113979 TaxID=1176131 RepID=A0A6G1GLI4_9PEZI|nr:PIG-X-domain-containing protein [Aulographum hederae CBS 113979]
MRERITYLLHDPRNFQLDQLKISKNALEVRNLKAAKEHQLTVGLNDLPTEIRDVLTQSHEIHIRWASAKPYESIAPFSSRVAPGLHVFFTPLRDNSARHLCPLLQDLFDEQLKCKSPQKSFTPLSPPSPRFSTSSSHQYHALVPDLSSFLTYINAKVCSNPSANSSSLCSLSLPSLRSVSFLDINYDAISHALVINAYWAGGPEKGVWNEVQEKQRSDDTLEIGVLNNEQATEKEELKLGGFLTVLGEHDEPKQTLFSFPSRHHPLSPLTSHYTFSFPSPTGLHPHAHITLPHSALTPPSPHRCSLHTYLTLPSAIFLDRYQFSDPLFLTSLNLKSLRHISGATDLEAPDYVVDEWGSAALFEIDVPNSKSKAGGSSGKSESKREGDFVVDIPLHLRYLTPTNSTTSGSPQGTVSLDIPHPILFWACVAEDGTKMSSSPFDRVNLGYDSLFGDRTYFYHLSPAGAISSGAKPAVGRLVETIHVPVLDLSHPLAHWIEWGTVMVVVLGAGWIMGRLWDVVGGGSAREEGSKKEN